MIKMGKPGALNVIVIDVDGAVVQQKRLMDQYQPTVIPLQKNPRRCATGVGWGSWNNSGNCSYLPLEQ